MAAATLEPRQLDSAQIYLEENGEERAVGNYPEHWPAPVHKQVYLVKTIMIPMRDGKYMATDLYFPPGNRKDLPTIFMRTPYGKNYWHGVEPSKPRYLASHGYVVAVQDARGRYESQGIFKPSTHDVADGYDSVEWLSEQPWSNGRVGGYGCSYLGDAQNFMAQEPHAALRAIIPDGAGGTVGGAEGRYRYFGAKNGGANELAAGVGWFFGAGNGTKIFYRPPPWLGREDYLKYFDHFQLQPSVDEPTYKDLWWILPLNSIPETVDSIPTDFNNFFEHDLGDPWWRQFRYFNDDTEYDVPALLVNGWFDYGVAETLLEHNLYRSKGKTRRSRENQFVIISPMTHCLGDTATENTLVGERPMGDARFDYMGTYLKWYDYHLKGMDNAIHNMPRVQYFLMGKNEWQSAASWPVDGVSYRSYYLSSKRGANSRQGDGRLSTSIPSLASVDTYVYDPANPVPSLGGALCCTGTDQAEGGSFDQSEIEMRDDVLVYTTEALVEGIEVVGSLAAELFVSSSAPDTDFTVKLVDVYPDGRAFNIQEGILRARYRDDWLKPSLMEPGEIYQLRVDMQATANYFAKGHQIRIEVSSSNFPRFDRNLNTGGNNYDESDWVVARNRIHHGPGHPSRVILPVRENKGIKP